MTEKEVPCIDTYRQPSPRHLLVAAVLPQEASVESELALAKAATPSAKVAYWKPHSDDASAGDDVIVYALLMMICCRVHVVGVAVRIFELLQPTTAQLDDAVAVVVAGGA